MNQQTFAKSAKQDRAEVKEVTCPCCNGNGSCYVGYNECGNEGEEDELAECAWCEGTGTILR